MQEPLVTYETALLAYTKGFDWVTRNFYMHGNSKCFEWNHPIKNSDIDRVITPRYSSPTQSNLQMWLREKGVEVWAEPYHNQEQLDGTYCFTVNDNGHTIIGVDFDSFPQSLGIGLIDALNLLPDVTK